jgi:hypothetical protein
LQLGAASLQQENANLAIVRAGCALAGFCSEWPVTITGHSRVSVMMVVVMMMAVMVRVRVSAAAQMQTVVMMILGREPMQAVPQQRNGAVYREKRASG